MINVVEVKTKKQKKQFVDFPTRLYEGNNGYVHPLRMDEMNLFSPKKNVSFDECDIVFYLAYKDGKVAGRICGIVQKVYNEKTGTKKVRFTRFDCIEDYEVAEALIHKVEDWARMQGMTCVHGPLGFNDMDREGLLVEGFDRVSTFEEPYNYPYYKDYLEKLGYSKDCDYLSFRIKMPKETDSRVLRIRDLVMKRYNLRIAEAKNKRQYIKKYKDQIFDLLDEAYGDLYGVIPYNDKLRKQIIDQFKMIIKMDYIVSVLDENDRMVAFGFALPSLSQAVRKCRGKLFPTGIFRILHATGKSNNEADFGLIGVRKEFQGKGLTAIILDYIVSKTRKLGIEVVETNHSLEDNHKILQTWKNFDDVEQHKRFRIFTKDLFEKKEKKKTIKSKSKKPAKKTKAKTTKKVSSKTTKKETK
ncbi:MAG: hypothetical protein IJW59_05720 [Clostridia bacterium]|nr:hypothetical protein [Clostridia bacterium]